MNKIHYKYTIDKLLKIDKYTIDKLLKIDKYIFNKLILNFNEF